MSISRQKNRAEFCQKPSKDKSPARAETVLPKTFRAKSIKFHGLFGLSMVRQHFFQDEKWTPVSLCDRLSSMANLLASRVTYFRHLSKANRMSLQSQSKCLRSQCIDGRNKLQNITGGHNVHRIYTYLRNHKEMLRLYKRMPIHLVVDNMNQRTFVLRKERDRLRYRLNELKRRYKDLLLERSKAENLVRYEKTIDEGVESSKLLRKIYNSNIRLKAIRSIHNTYEKMVQILMHERIFYEPILRSLEDDMQDQANLIKNILHMGLPAIAKFKELNEKYRLLEANSRKKLKEKMQMLGELGRPKARFSPQPISKMQYLPSADATRYRKSTRSMESLKMQLQSIENTIKEVKLVSLDSQAREIYPQLKNLLENNVKLQRAVEHDEQDLQVLRDKKVFASAVRTILANNLSLEEIARLQKIEYLRDALNAELRFEEQCKAYLVNRANIFVLIRLSIWNLIDILRHVDGSARTCCSHYPNPYLKLPLLKFEMHQPISVPPELYEENVDKLMHLLRQKVYKLKKAYEAGRMEPSLKASRDKYHRQFLASRGKGSYEQEDAESETEMDVDFLQAPKIFLNIPNRKQIKARSVRLIEKSIIKRAETT